ncbi:MAG: hypothetical protein Q4F01_09950 [Staphylococcus rostri]|uniref:hypothetical protein n=1 Tax=Staphylococcus rostri TaxID=522262 RepID=UPI0026DEF3D5|nr:hypothetical protein [Staphylococcus rostri]MDO5376487.1 hypothetical protein [Staphylococcus rostri]
MGRKISAIILGIITIVTAWSTIKMFIALAHTSQELQVSYAPLPIQLHNPNSTVLIFSSIIYSIVTISMALVTIKLSKPKKP